EYRVEDKSSTSTCEFDLQISLQGSADPKPQLVESFEKLSMDTGSTRYATLIVNDAFSGSAYITLTNLKASFTGRSTPAGRTLFPVGQPTPTTPGLTRIAGSDGDAPSTNDYKSALTRYDSIAIQLLACLEDMPDGLLRAVTRAGLDYCVSAN